MTVTRSKKKYLLKSPSSRQANSELLMLSTAGILKDQAGKKIHQQFPRTDYVEMQKRFNASVIDYGVYEQSRFGSIFRYLETQIRSDLYLAMLGIAVQHRAKVVFAWSERVGIPFAQLRRFLPNPTPLVSMFQCWSPLQEMAMLRLNLFDSMNMIVLHCNSMRDHFIKLGVSPDKLKVVHYGRDEQFFKALPNVPQRKAFALSVGEHRSRDYARLFAAVRGLPIELAVVASGHWYAREKNQMGQFEVPPNVTLVSHLPLIDLRQLYAQAQFVILPLNASIYSAGATVSLEAMAMGRPVIATNRPGIRDYVLDGHTGLLVAPDSTDALRGAISSLLLNPQKAQELGQNARRRSEQELGLNRYVTQLGDIIQQFL